MRAMILKEPKLAEGEPLLAADLAKPIPLAGEIRVRVSVCGICRTDLHTVEGELLLPRLPLVPGHQIVGVVDAIGAGVRQFHEGDRVGIPWLHWVCGKCFYCKKGEENLCDHARFTGYHVHGGYAEWTVVEEPFAYKLPKNFSDLEAAPLLCAGIIGYRSLKLSGVKPGDRLGLWGFGSSAHIVLQVAKHMGCQVYVFTRAEAHRHLAAKLGANWVGDSHDAPPAPIDGAIIFAPVGALALDALRVMRKGGTVALAGITMSPIPEIDYPHLLYHERVLRSVANNTRQDVREFLQLAAEIPVRTEVRAFSLAEANLALQTLKRDEIQGSAAIKIAE
jgi:alcohol dehydrogenase, propanol-preferring